MSNNKLKNRYTHIDYIQDENKDDLKVNNCTLKEQTIINILNSKKNGEWIVKIN